MEITTNGIALIRSERRHYDESIGLLTDTFGKLNVFSYGSRSPRSQRRLALMRPQWLRVQLLCRTAAASEDKLSSNTAHAAATTTIIVANSHWQLQHAVVTQPILHPKPVQKRSSSQSC